MTASVRQNGERKLSQPRLVEIAIEPGSKADAEKLGIALAKLAAEDPAFGRSTDHESGQTILNSGASGQFAAVKLRVAPNEPGEGYRFESRISGSAVPTKYIPGIEKGIESVLPSGVVAGFPVIDIKVELIDGKYHDTDSSALAFEIAARAAFREALQKAACDRDACLNEASRNWDGRIEATFSLL